MSDLFNIEEEWLQEVTVSIAKLPALTPSASKAAMTHVETQMRLLIQQAMKFQRHSRSSLPTLSVDHINQALTMNKKENLYGFCSLNGYSRLLPSHPKITDPTKNISLVSLLATQPPPPPAAPEIHMHWLAVEGSQPQIPDNPTIESSNSSHLDYGTESLSSELKILFQRISSVLLLIPTSQEPDESSSIGFRPKDSRRDRERTFSISAVIELLRSDSSLQNLVPNLCRFFYQTTKNKKQHIYTLHVVVKALDALVANRTVYLQNHLIQVLPSLFACIVANQLGQSGVDSNIEAHWMLRDYTSRVIAFTAWRYSDVFPDLVSRVLKTYLEALDDDKSLPTVYGGLVGLISVLTIPIGNQYVTSSDVIVQSILNCIAMVYTRINKLSKDISDTNAFNKGNKDTRVCITMCSTALGNVLGILCQIASFPKKEIYVNRIDEKKRKRQVHEQPLGHQPLENTFDVIDELGDKLVPFYCKFQRIKFVLDPLANTTCSEDTFYNFRNCGRRQFYITIMNGYTEAERMAAEWSKQQRLQRKESNHKPYDQDSRTLSRSERYDPETSRSRHRSRSRHMHRDRSRGVSRDRPRDKSRETHKPRERSRERIRRSSDRKSKDGNVDRDNRNNEIQNVMRNSWSPMRDARPSSNKRASPTYSPYEGNKVTERLEYPTLNSTTEYISLRRDRSRSRSQSSRRYRSYSRSRSNSREKAKRINSSWSHDKFNSNIDDDLPRRRLPSDYRPPSPTWVSRAGGVAIIRRSN